MITRPSSTRGWDSSRTGDNGIADPQFLWPFNFRQQSANELFLLHDLLTDELGVGSCLQGGNLVPEGADSLDASRILDGGPGSLDLFGDGIALGDNVGVLFQRQLPQAGEELGMPAVDEVQDVARIEAAGSAASPASRGTARAAAPAAPSAAPSSTAGRTAAATWEGRAPLAALDPDAEDFLGHSSAQVVENGMPEMAEPPEL